MEVIFTWIPFVVGGVPEATCWFIQCISGFHRWMIEILYFMTYESGLQFCSIFLNKRSKSCVWPVNGFSGHSSWQWLHSSVLIAPHSWNLVLPRMQEAKGREPCRHSWAILKADTSHHWLITIRKAVIITIQASSWRAALRRWAEQQAINSPKFSKVHPIGLVSKLAFMRKCAQLHFGSISVFWAVSMFKNSTVWSYHLPCSSKELDNWMHPIGLVSKLAFHENCAQLHFGSISGFWAVSDPTGTQLFDPITHHVSAGIKQLITST